MLKNAMYKVDISYYKFQYLQKTGRFQGSEYNMNKMGLSIHVYKKEG